MQSIACFICNSWDLFYYNSVIKLDAEMTYHTQAAVIELRSYVGMAL